MCPDLYVEANVILAASHGCYHTFYAVFAVSVLSSICSQVFLNTVFNSKSFSSKMVVYPSNMTPNTCM